MKRISEVKPDVLELASLLLMLSVYKDVVDPGVNPACISDEN